MARVLALAYRLSSHRLGGWMLDRWGVTLAWGVAVLGLAQSLLADQPASPTWRWAAIALLFAAGAALLGLKAWGARRSFACFEAASDQLAPAENPLQPEDKVPLRATGRFEVEGRRYFFADLQAYWRSYASREHAVLAVAHPTRFLLVGQFPDERVGMWYIFMQPSAIEEVTAGYVRFGRRAGSGLRVIHRHQPPAPEGKRPPKPVREVVYLTFGDAAARDRVWADLLADRASMQPLLERR